jgi:hypothetical protein
MINIPLAVVFGTSVFEIVNRILCLTECLQMRVFV